MNHLYYKPWSVAPRIGLAYAFNPKTVVRASYGMFYNRYISQITDGLAKGDGSYQPSYSLQSTVAAQFAAGPAFPNYLTTQPSGAANAPTIEFDLPGFRNSYSEQAQLSVQRELNKSTSVTVSGIWSRGLHIVSGYNANMGTPTQSYTYLVDNAAGNRRGPILRRFTPAPCSSIRTITVSTLRRRITTAITAAWLSPSITATPTGSKARRTIPGRTRSTKHRRRGRGHRVQRRSFRDK